MKDRWILIVGDERGAARDLVPRVEALGLSARRAASIVEAAALLRTRFGVVAAVIDVDLVAAAPAPTLGELRDAARGGQLESGKGAGRTSQRESETAGRAR